MSVSRQEPTKRRIDRLLPRSGVPAVLYFAALVALLLLAPALPRRAELAADGVVFLAAGAWCGLNFWRCRQAHCVVSAAGWLGLSPVAFAGAGLGRSLIHGDEQLFFSWRGPGRARLRVSPVPGKGNQRHRPHGTLDRARREVDQWQPGWPQAHSWPPWLACSLQ